MDERKLFEFMCACKSLVSLTFDDGRGEQYSKFYPILDENDLKATFYIVTERINWKGFMGWDELRTLHKDGNEIGSHTHTHPHLATLSNDELDFEFKKSHDILRIFNCCTLAYPYGEYNEKIVDHAKQYFIAARGYYDSNIGSKDPEANLDLNQDRFKLKTFPIEHTIQSPATEVLQNYPLFALPFSKFKQTLKELIEYNTKRKAWIIFTFHGHYTWKNISWVFRKPKETVERLAVRITKRSSTQNFARRNVLTKDKMLKFKWMCEFFAQNDQTEVLPVSQVIKKHLVCPEKSLRTTLYK
ncbi:MAG: polysaccharide deacetylase family protein [Candidatus Bathyarchaeota archaeon]|nr:polysaccharide deacetylase family protein [Candidatus Bathyarchaeota archaeon]